MGFLMRSFLYPFPLILHEFRVQVLDPEFGHVKRITKKLSLTKTGKHLFFQKSDQDHAPLSWFPNYSKIETYRASCRFHQSD